MTRSSPGSVLWLSAGLLSRLLLGCDDAGAGTGGATDAAVPVVDAAGGGAGDQGAGGAGGAPDAAGPPVLPAHDSAASAATPVLVGGRLLVAGPEGVQGAGGPLGEALAAGGRLADAVVVAPEAVEGAAVFAVVDTGAARRLVALDAAGATAWTLDVGAGALRRPALRHDRLLVVSSDAAGAWQAQWLSRADGAVLATLPLGAGPATPPARLLTTDDEWLLGVGGALVALRVTEPPDAPAVLEETARVDAEVAQVTSVQTTGRWLVSATGWQDAARVGEAGLGDRLVFAGRSDGGPAGTSLYLVDHPVSTPDVIQAPPVVLRAISACVGADCVRKAEGVVASGGSHWFGGWQSETGAPLFVRTDLPERVTGLAVGGDDRVFSGGSHWLPGTPEAGHVLRAWQVGADAESNVVAADALLVDAREGGPVVGASSALVREGTLTYAVTGADGAVAVMDVPVEGAAPARCGWPRAFGDDANAGNHVTVEPADCD